MVDLNEWLGLFFWWWWWGDAPPPSSTPALRSERTRIRGARRRKVGKPGWGGYAAHAAAHMRRTPPRTRARSAAAVPRVPCINRSNREGVSE